ncbi:hypothetical protein QTP88_015971 [Uroleucon formosanum]
MQLRNKRRQWTTEEKNLALTMFYKSPATYNFLRLQNLNLPGPSTVRDWIGQSKFLPGFNKIFMTHLKKKFEFKEYKEKACSISFDEISIKEFLEYSKDFDFIEGYEDLGRFGRTSNTANSCLVFMARGINSSWKTSVTYFLAHSAVKHAVLKNLIIDVLQELFDIGILPKVIICDQGSNNQSALKSLNVTENKPYFYVNENKIISLFDTPHLLKSAPSPEPYEPEKYKRTIFLDTETEKISSMVYGGENVLVVESKNQEGCRVLLNRSDLIRLQYLEGTIFEIIHLTTTYTHTLLSKQVRAFIMYLEEKFSQMQSPPVNEEEIIMFIKRNTDCQLVQSEPILTSQIQFFAAAHVAARLIERKARNSPLLFDGEHGMESPMSPMSLPTHNTFNHVEDKSIDHHDKLWTSDEIHFPQPCDENDGPDFLRALSPSQFITPPPFTVHPTPVRKVKRQLF